jgi:hypothetical protein
MLFAAIAHDRFWHETDVLCVPTNVCSWGKSGRAADITAMTEVDPKLTSRLIAATCQRALQ